MCGVIAANEPGFEKRQPRKKEFRLDLYYRLNVVSVKMPAAAGAAERHSDFWRVTL